MVGGDGWLVGACGECGCAACGAVCTAEPSGQQRYVACGGALSVRGIGARDMCVCGRVWLVSFASAIPLAHVHAVLVVRHAWWMSADASCVVTGDLSGCACVRGVGLRGRCVHATGVGVGLCGEGRRES